MLMESNSPLSCWGLKELLIMRVERCAYLLVVLSSRTATARADVTGPRGKEGVDSDRERSVERMGSRPEPGAAAVTLGLLR